MILLSLTKKDLVATFNWDPLLLQAYQRCCTLCPDELPDMAFLHGNVLLGQCINGHKTGGIIYAKCPICHESFTPSRLLYPIRKKGYSNDGYIKNNWNRLEEKIRKAYLVTIFGYSAPKTDREAMDILHKAWGNSIERKLEQIEIIDIQDENYLQKTWDGFIYNSHVDYYKNFFESRMAQFPRRATVELFDATMNSEFTKPTNSFYKEITWDEIKNIMISLLREEQEANDYGSLSVKFTNS